MIYLDPSPERFRARDSTMATVRNTPTQRRCPGCEGAGSLEFRHPSGNPELESDLPCTHAGCIDGWIRWAPTDALAVLAAERRGVLALKRATYPNPDEILLPSARRYYARAKAAATRPVKLPADRVPTLAELYANLDRALQVAA
jgi:hypothetical protein